MLSWKQFTEYAAEFRLKPEYVAENKPFFDKEFFQAHIVFDYSVMNNGKSSVLRNMRM